MKTPKGIDIAFRSGMSSKSDLRGAIEAGVPVGVEAGHLSLAQYLLVLPRYLDQGGKAFIDSGAFGAFQNGESMNWPRIFSVYDTVASMTDHHNNLTVVAPDKVGDQTETLRLLALWRERIVKLINLGCHVIVPIQCGELPGQKMIEAVAEILGTSSWAAGVPSNKAAMSVEECATLCHGDFHILGRVDLDDEQAQRIAALRTHNPGAAITADANFLRSRIGKLSSMTSMARSYHTANKSGFDHPRVKAVAQLLRAEAGWGTS